MVTGCISKRLFFSLTTVSMIIVEWKRANMMNYNIMIMNYNIALALRMTILGTQRVDYFSINGVADTSCVPHPRILGNIFEMR
jgi:hypothetical protein